MYFFLGLTNIDLRFRFKGCGFGDKVSNFKRKKLKISK